MNGRETFVDFSFNEKIKESVKSAGGARWDGEAKKWFIRNDRVKYLIESIKSKRIAMTIDKEIQKHFNLNKQGKTKEEIEERENYKKNHSSYAIKKDDFDTSYLNFKEGMKLYPYQVAGTYYGIKKNGRVLLGDDMGLGKTAQGIAIARHFQKDWPLFIVVPASLLLNWKKELLQWLPDINEDDITIIKKGTQRPKGLITISSYDYTHKKENVITNYLGIKGVLLIDEAHGMKNPEAKRTKSLIRISHAAKRCIIMTGTPFLSRPFEIWPLLYALNPEHKEWNNSQTFAEKYCEGKVIKMGNQHIFYTAGSSNMEEFHDLVRDELMVRRLKTDDGVLDQLPPKRRYTQYLEADENTLKSIETIKTELTNIISEYYVSSNGDLRYLKRQVLAHNSDMEDDIFKAYRLAGLAKVHSICDWISDKLDSGTNKLIIFGHHKDFLDGIQERLVSKKINFMRIDGSTNKDKRFENTEEFQNNEECRVALLSINAASVGLTLTAASNVLIGEMPWTPALAQQAECRAHRNGQLELVNCYYAIANKTFDGILWDMLSRKSVSSNNMLDGGFGDEMEEELEVTSTDILEAAIFSYHEEQIKLAA
jgi:SWI/SNF-related matrix-associated actin-dependent regulator 1 of chromatin subfamily A